MKSNEIGKRTQFFLGSFENVTNQKKPYKYDKLTEQTEGKGVEAQVELYLYNNKSFTVTVSLRKKRDHSVDLTFEGDKPSWLKDDDKAVFHGQLMLSIVKDLDAKYSP